MSYAIAKCRTKFGTQIRIVRHERSKTKYIKTIGTAKDELAISALLTTAQKYLDTINNTLWSDPDFDLHTLSKQGSPVVELPDFKTIKVIHSYAYAQIAQVWLRIFPQTTLPQLFKDLCILRVIAPSSKREAVELFAELFNLHYSLNQIYYLKESLLDQHEQIKRQILDFAIENLHVDFKLIFYDVTTIYFESFTEDDLKKCGFSKDLKFNQPQLVLGLLVDRTGFPLTYRLFEGDTFEGKTFLPVVKKYKAELGIKTLTVVADAAMMSKVTFTDLEQENISYIIGARLSNMKRSVLEEIVRGLPKIDQCTIRLPYQKHSLVVHYSIKRAAKDKTDRLKQVAKAEAILESKKAIKRSIKFLQAEGKESFSLNTKLIEQAEKIEGFKGYHTNLDIPDLEIVSQYSNLWKIEQNFRVAKSDLEIRPVYHWKEKGVKFHILLNFVALAMSKLIEIEEQKSVRAYVKAIMQVKEFQVQSKKTGQIFVIK